jgi:solute carrier family 50 protein (sugar transporter)
METIKSVASTGALALFIAMPLLPSMIANKDMPLLGPDSLQENVAIGITIFSPLGLWQVFASMQAENSVGSFNVLSVVSMYLNGAMWFLYGVAANIPPAYIVNSVCTIFGAYYTLVFYACAEGAQKREAGRYIGFAVFLTVGFCAFLTVGPSEIVPKPGAEGEELAYNAMCMGYVCIVFNVLLYAAPLVTVSEVLKTKSTKSLSFETTLTNMCLSAMWLINGFYRNDLPTIVPNGIGVVLSAAQLLLFAAFPSEGGGGKQD